ncbi:MAG: hypothetical protein CMM02_03830 [Rhodopirellula sp.]|nr:hypothetical protein [Rhodopirellula sp.]|tara:strand:+ start:8011 stop:9066 length:1056 start_codon:yes stop_codon:yes gene_type:complete
MHTGIISFADRIAYNIKSNEIKDIILNKLYELYNIKIIQRHYYLLSNNNLNYINNKSYLCCLRSNGNPYYVFFTLYNDIPIIYFIDKKIHPNYEKPRIILVRGLFDKSLYNNTLLDGEMIKTYDKKWIFAINDIISYKGQHLKRINLEERLEIVYNLLEKDYKRDEYIDVCKFVVKTYYKIHEESIKNLIEISNKLNYSSRGIYLWNYNLNYKPILYNFNEENIINVVRKTKDDSKFKTLEMIEKNIELNINSTNKDTLEENINKLEGNNKLEEDEKILWVSKTSEPDVYYLYLKENIQNEKHIGIANVSSLSTSKMLRLSFKDINSTILKRYKCRYNKNFSKWQPLYEIK